MRSELDAGTNVNAVDDDGWTPLHYAAGMGTLENIQVLLEAGGNINAANDDGTPLHPASWYGSLENIKALLVAGADVMARDNDGWIPLHYAARRDGAFAKDDLIFTDAFKALKMATCGEGNWFKNIIRWCG